MMASGGGSYASPPQSSPGSAATVTIVPGASAMTTTAFSPNPLNVSVGTTVTWLNNDGTAHTSTSDGGAWSSPIIAPGGQFSFTFQSAGTFPYHCMIHPNMVGTVSVACLITLTPATLPNGTVGAVYAQTLSASGGTAPYVFTPTSGTLPPGLTLSAAGVLSGTPTTAGSFTITLRASDATGCFGELSFPMSISTAVPALPRAFVLLIALGLAGAGYLRLRLGSGFR